MADAVTQHSSEGDPVGSFASAVAAPELHSVDSSDAAKVVYVYLYRCSNSTHF